MIIEIKEIENNKAIDFLYKNKAYKEKIYISNNDTWIGAIYDKNIIGCIGKKGKRIRCFYVIPNFRKNGIGADMLCEIIKNNDELTAYATNYSYNLFLKHGFKVINQNPKTKIYFLRRGKNE